MDQKELEEDHLAQANRHIAEGMVRIEQQKAIIDELAADGHDTTDAESLLTEFSKSLQLMHEHRERILEELNNAL